MKNIIKYKLSILLFGCLTFIQIKAVAQHIKGGNNRTEILNLDTAVRKGQLPNGFTYYIRHNEEPKNRVIMYLANKVGSVLEDDDEQGLAHFMEHMNFNGTVHFPKNELVNYLQKSGVRFGADLNAYTSFDETVYQLPIPSDNPELLKNGLEIMRDWAQGALLDSIEINKERGVVLEEKRLGKGYAERMDRLALPVILNNSRYATRLPIGIDTVLNNFKPEVIRRFYKKWYRPDLQAIIIVGDIDVNVMEAAVKEKFADLQNPVNERVRTNYQVPLTGKNTFLALTDKEMPGTTAEITFKYPKDEFKTVDDYRNFISRYMVSSMLSSRYDELAKKESPPFINSQAYMSRLMNNLDCYTIGVETNPGNFKEGFKAAWRETIRAKRFGFTLTELARAKAAYLTSMGTLADEEGKIGSDLFVGDYLDNFLNGTAAAGIERNYQLVKILIPGITLTDVNNILNKHVSFTNRSILIEAAEKDKHTLPNEQTVENWLNEVSAEPIKPYRDEVITKPLLVAEPGNNGRIISAEYNVDLNLTKWTLNNGAQVYIKPTNFKNDEIKINCFSQAGTSVVADADYENVDDAAFFISSSGLGNYTSNQLDRFLNGKVINMLPYIDAYYQGVDGWTRPKDLKTSMQMIYGYFTEPHKDLSVYNNIMEKSRSGLVNRSADPEQVFRDSLKNIMGNYNYRVSPPSIGKLNNTNFEKVYSGYHNRFADASGFKFTFVGNLDTNILKPLVIKYLASLPSIHRNEVIKDLNIHPVQGKVSKTIYAGNEPKSSVVLVFSGNYDFNQKNNIKMDALKECLEIRLIQRLREDESGVYSPSVAATTEMYPHPQYKFVIRFGCAPQNVEKLIASTLDEVNILKKDGPIQENVDKWFVETKTAYEPALKENDFWSEYLSNRLKNNENLENYKNQINLMKDVSPSDVKNFAAQYLNDNNFIRVVLLPEQMKI